MNQDAHDIFVENYLRRGGKEDFLEMSQLNLKELMDVSSKLKGINKERKNMSGGGANGNIGSLSVTGTQIVRLNMKRGLPGG